MIKKSQITGITGWVRSCSSWYFEASGAFRSHTATLCQSLPAKCCADCENHLPATFQPFQLDRCLKKWVGPGVILMKAYESYYSVSLSYISYIHKYIYISMMPRETHNMPIFELMPVEIAANQTKWTWTVWTTAVILVYMNGFQSHLTSHLSLSIILDNSLGPSWPRFPHAKSLLCVPLETRTARKRST